MKQTTLLIAAALAVTGVLRAEKLVIKGSDTLGAKLVPQLSEEYKARNPGVSFEIAAEGSTTGIAAIIDGTAQIGMSSRRAKPTEMSAAGAKGVVMKPTIVAYDGIAVIVKVVVPSATAGANSRLGMSAARNSAWPIGAITNIATNRLTPP